MSYQRVSYFTMVCEAARFSMIFSLMNGILIRVSIGQSGVKVFKAL